MKTKFDMLHSFLYSMGIQPHLDTQSSLGARVGDQVYHGGTVEKRFPPPVLRDERKHAVFDFVPLACARMEMTDPYREMQFICEFLEFDLPEFDSPAVASAAVRGDEVLLALEELAVALEAVPLRQQQTTDRIKSENRLHFRNFELAEAAGDRIPPIIQRILDRCSAEIVAKIDQVHSYHIGNPIPAGA